MPLIRREYNGVILQIIRNPNNKSVVICFSTGKKGRFYLNVMNPPTKLEAAIGCHVTWDNEVIRIGETIWAERVGKVSMKLCMKPDK